MPLRTSLRTPVLVPIHTRRLSTTTNRRPPSQTPAAGPGPKHFQLFPEIRQLAPLVGNREEAYRMSDFALFHDLRDKQSLHLLVLRAGFSSAHWAPPLWLS